MRRLSLALAAVAAVLGLVALRFVGTGWERASRWEDAVGRAGRRESFDNSLYAQGLDALLTAIVPLAAAALGLWLLERYRAGERRLAVACVGSVGGAVLTAEILKLVLSARAGVPHKLAHGFPSGHTTGACATALAYLVAARGTPRFRPLALAAGYTTLVAGGVVVDGWHLPSDAAGALCLASAWLLGALALLDPPRRIAVAPRDVAAAAGLTALVAAVLLAHPALPAHAHLVGEAAQAVVGLAAATFVATVAVTLAARR